MDGLAEIIRLLQEANEVLAEQNARPMAIEEDENE